MHTQICRWEPLARITVQGSSARCIASQLSATPWAIVGLTCRVGRAVYGTIDIIRSVVKAARASAAGSAGVGKTTKCREVARVLSEE